MQESFLHYLWQFQYFDRANLATANGEEITVFDPGTRNSHAGPDFSDARVRIGGIEWFGSVEIHINSSGWNDHRHAADPAYDNVILHVVWKNDETVCRSDMTLLPTLELQGRVSESILLKYRSLIHNPEPIPCAASIASVSNGILQTMIRKTVVERLEARALAVTQILHANNDDWEETCYQMVCRNFGFKVNSEAFMMLAKALPYKFLMKHADRPLQVEALLFGQAGMLDKPEDDDYFRLLRREFDLLSHKFSLSETRLRMAQWKFLRLRPANFPTIRIAQLATLLSSQRNLFSRFVGATDYQELVKMLDTRQSEYWQRHYHFRRRIDDVIPGLGRNSIDNIIINTVVPLLMAYGKARDERRYSGLARGILEKTGAEDNAIVRKWQRLGVSCSTAHDSQGVIEIHNKYCLRRRCLSCAIGVSLLRPVNI